MMHSGFPDVKDLIYLWRDKHGVLHASEKNDGYTKCGKDTDYLTYGGRMTAPTCLECVIAP